MADEATSETILVPQDAKGERLDKFIYTYYNEKFSRSYLQKLIEQKLVLVDGSAVKKRFQVSPEEEIEVAFTLEKDITLEPQDIPLEILYEDEDFIAVNKPSGMVVHPAPGNWSNTFVNALLFYCQGSLTKDATLRPGIVHRLDKDTSGCLLGAKNLHCQQKLIELFSNRKIEKTYLAICLGNPGHGTIDKPLGRHPVKRKEITVLEEGGKPAITHFETLGSAYNLSLVKLRIETGRTHQIRVHMKAHGTPILGDETYGNTQTNKKHKVSSQLLHAYSLSFLHPLKQKPITIQATPPKDFLNFSKKIAPNIDFI